MTFNYYLAWLHFDSRGRMTTRLQEGHRVLEVLHSSTSNRTPPALWVLVEAVVATPSYTPSAGFPAAGDMTAEFRQSPHPSGPVPVPAAPGYEYHESSPDTVQQQGRTTYPELFPEARDDDYRANDYVPGVRTSPARM